MGNTDKFDLIANSYDTPERVQIAKVSADAIRECLRDSKNKDAIDFGCGTGLVGINLLGEFKELLFLDTSHNMLDIIDRKIADIKAVSASTLCFDLEKSAIPNIRADYVFMVQVLLHIRDYEPVLAKLYNILDNKGHLLIVDFNKNDKIISDMVHNGFDQDQLEKTLAKIGFKDIYGKTFYTGSKMFMGQDASLFIMEARK